MMIITDKKLELFLEPIIKAYREGAMAAKNGLLLLNCPYETYTTEYHAWCNGFFDNKEYGRA